MPVDLSYFTDEEKLEALRASQRARFDDEDDVTRVATLHSQWRELRGKIDVMGRELNKLQKKKIGPLYGKKRRAEGEELEALNRELESLLIDKSQIEHQIADSKVELQRLASERDRIHKNIGNIVDPSVPVSQDEEHNDVVATWGLDDKRATTDDLKHHHELLYMIGGYDPDAGTEVAGHRGYFLTGPGVLLNMALQQYGVTFLMARGYTPVQPPFFMKKEIMAETAQLSEFDEALYHVVGETAVDHTGELKRDENYLIATSEQPLSAMNRDKVLDEATLTEKPIRLAGMSACFRKEAGAHGRDAWGIFRVHQFDKVEQFCITAPEHSVAEHEKMRLCAEEFYQSLKLPYNVVNIVSGELNNAAAKKLDLEAWFPTLGVFRELVSCSNCTDYQSRAMRTYFGHKKTEGGQRHFVHMLNATLCATTRTICCILENYQTPEGVRVPEVLQPFMGGVDFLPFVKDAPVNKTKLKMQKKKAKQQQK